ncbi:enoyl-CoA hydratase/isomerase [Microdochium trichocladiopsis]|uniref:Enoyl-CoA hydratase/isomerase n=1 Tax=Microdochium trichocladiopsis TaxID=1682393 RepID=A0A9P9BMM8_9PEZI|nr:enoyl-CoA hydratase/isomerase [Microdochium trichocladiopsis]KAH7026036.1 enoyl-CoA hydratase/isomerase [Microdochium trichocladiopsis]
MANVKGYEAEHFIVTAPAEYVLRVEINRPKKLNAFFEPMWLELGALMNKASHDPDYRAVVITAAGDRAFTAGLDVEAAGEGGLLGTSTNLDPARKATTARRHIAEFQDSITAIEKCEKPVIVALHGLCIGLAIDLASCADVRFCTKDARFSVKEVDIGIAADIGTLTRLPKIVGSFSWVKEVTMSARWFDADEALRVGFVSRILDNKAKAVEAALEYASLLAGKSPIAVQGTKELLNHARDNTVADSLRYTAIWNASMIQCKDTEDALLAGLKKRTPTFSKL